MNATFERVEGELPNQPFAKDVVSFIVFGSSVFNANRSRKPDDVDVCVVVRDRTTDLKPVADYIFTVFEKPDFRIYFLDEVNSDLHFMDKGVGVFALEYFSHGRCLYGENIFIDKLKTAEKQRLKDSYLHKIFEYIIRIREAQIAKTSTPEYKSWHINKYIIRLLIDILLYNSYVTYADMKKMSPQEVVDMCKQHNIIRQDAEANFDDSEKMYGLFQEINNYVVAAHSCAPLSERTIWWLPRLSRITPTRIANRVVGAAYSLVGLSQ